MPRLRDHGIGVGNPKAPIHVDSTIFKEQVAIQTTVTSGAPMNGARYLGDGIFVHFQLWSGTTYNVVFINAQNKVISTIQQYAFGTAISGTQPISRTCKLPDGRYAFSFWGNIYAISTNLSTITQVKSSGTYGAYSNSSVIALYMSTQGKLIVFNFNGKVMMLNPTTFALESELPGTAYSLTANGAGQIYEDNNVLIVKDGNLTGDFIKISKSVVAGTDPILFKGNSSNARGLVSDGSTYYYITNGSFIEKRLISTMGLVSQHAPANLPSSLFWDSLKKRVIVQSNTTGKLQGFDPVTNTFDIAYQNNDLTSNVGEYGAEDPDNYRVLISGKTYNYGIKRI